MHKLVLPYGAMIATFTRQTNHIPALNGNPPQVNFSVLRDYHQPEKMVKWLEQNPQCTFEEVKTKRCEATGLITPTHHVIHCPTDEDYVLAKCMFGEGQMPQAIDPMQVLK
jgi:hypothetical protein